MPIAMVFIMSVLSSVPAGFTALERAPSEDCANHSRDSWRVSSIDGKLSVARQPEGVIYELLPFEPKPPSIPDLNDRRVAKVIDGWLAGYDTGDIDGGALWWIDPNGRREYLITAQNVQGFAKLGNDTLVFVGIDHPDQHSGSILRLQRIGERWQVRPFATLDGRASAWIAESDRLLVLTPSGLWEVTANAPPRQLATLDIRAMAPTSLARGSDGALYVGMRRFVLKLEDGTWKETWLVPENAPCPSQ